MINTNFNPNNANWWSGAGNNAAAGQASAPAAGSPFGANNANTTPAQRESLLGLRRSAELLNESLNFMRGIGSRNSSSPMINRQAESSDTDVLTILAGAANNRSQQQNMSVEVIQLAQTQRNEGNALSSNTLASSAGFTVGNNQMSVTVGERQFDFNISISATDTVQDVQQRIASAVNARNIGVTASVNANQGQGTSALVLQSSESGRNNDDGPNFTVNSSQGNLANLLGAGNITQEAQNAEFRVNRGNLTGALQTSRSNDVSIGSGMRARLNETGTSEVALGRDETGQINAFRHMVNSFNGLVNSARESFGGSNSRLERELGGLARSSATALRRVGINMGQDGRMTIDEDRMAAAAENGDLERFANRDRVGGNSGFMNRLGRIAGNVNRNPASYMTPNVSEGFGPNINFSNRQVSQLHSLVGMGMLFDTNL